MPPPTGAATPRFFHRATAWLILAVLLVLVSMACRQAADSETPTRQPPPPTSGYPPDGATPPAYPAAPGSPAYPAPPSATDQPSSTASTTLSPTPSPTRPATNVTTATNVAPATPDAQSYLPIMPYGSGATPTFTPSPTNTPSPTPTPTIDFAAVRAGLQAQGQDLGFVKIGLHTGTAGNRNGLGEWMRRLDAAGVPFFIKTVDDSGPLVEAQQILLAGETPHTLVYRRSGDAYDTPDYDLSPEQAAQDHWDLHKAAFPSELNPSLVWLETINEVDKNQSPWLAEFALATARLALADGYRWAAFGWSSGEPEIVDWSSPAMLEFLRLAAANPDRLAIALHEYSYLTGDIGHEYPYKVGRFQQLFQVCDQYNIPRPTVLISEWGWEYQDIPSVDQALADIAWASSLYAPYPQVKGAAIWYLGGGFGDIHDQTQRLIRPLTDYALGNYFTIPLPPAQAPIDPDRFRP